MSNSIIPSIDKFVWLSQGSILNFEVSWHAKISVAITQKLFVTGYQKYTFLEKSLDWLSKDIKIYFIGTNSQKLDDQKYKICCDTHAHMSWNFTPLTSSEEIASN